MAKMKARQNCGGNWRGLADKLALLAAKLTLDAPVQVRDQAMLARQRTAHTLGCRRPTDPSD